MTQIIYDDGTWFNSTPTFTDRRTCAEGDKVAVKLTQYGTHGLELKPEENREIY